MIDERRHLALEVDDARLAGRLFDAVVVTNVDDSERGLAHRTPLRAPFVGVDQRDAVAFGGAVVLGEYRPPPRDHGVLDVGWARRSSVPRQPQRARVVP